MAASDRLLGSPQHVKVACDMIQEQFLLDDDDFHPVNLLTVDIYAGFETLNRILNQLVSGQRTLPTGVPSNNWELYNIEYVIFNREIHTRPWDLNYHGEPYRGIGGDFTDRLQIKFEADGAVPDSRADTQEEFADPAPQLTKAIDDMAALAAFLADRKKWSRIGAALFGGLLIVMGLARMTGAKQIVVPPGLKLVKAVK